MYKSKPNRGPDRQITENLEVTDDTKNPLTVTLHKLQRK